jgi:ATP-dependent helicase/nuclease subunit A
MAWTKEQQAAIDSRGQTLLLSAAAGSGKTAVLVERIIQRLLDRENPIDITELLVVTFTKAAAAEMRERIAQALAGELGGPRHDAAERQLALLPSAHISTLHSFCQAVIRRYFYRIDMDPRFTVAGEEELLLLQHRVLEELFLTYYENPDTSAVLYPLAEMFGDERGDEALMATIVKVYTFSRSLPWPVQWLHDAAAAYDIAEDAVIDDLPWTESMKGQVHSAIQGLLQELKPVLYRLDAYPTLEKGKEQMEKEFVMLAHVNEGTTWQELYTAANAVNYGRLVSLRKLSDEEKAFWEECKSVRNAVKKDFQELLDTYFSVSSEKWMEGIRTMKPYVEGLIKMISDFHNAYGLAKREKGWVDFNDLEHSCLSILLDPHSTPEEPRRSDAAEELHQHFKEILIDEYQDTNGVQEMIASLVAGKSNRFMVGDIKQSIYRFRLADPTLFMTKYQTYSREAGATERCIDLARNFRSDRRILEGINEVFARIMTKAMTGMEYGDREKLYPGRPDCTDDRWVGGTIEVHVIDKSGQNDALADVAQDAESDDGMKVEMTAFERECHYIADRLESIMASGQYVQRKDGTMEPVRWGHMVVLLRSMQQKSQIISQVFQKRGIPVYADETGGYFAAVEVQVMLGLLQIIDNPEQDLPMAAVLRSPIVGLDEADLAALRLTDGETLWQSVPIYVASLADGEKKEKVFHFSSCLEQWRTFSRHHSVAELIQRIYEDTGYYHYVGGMPGGAIRQANLKALFERARQYEASGFRGLFRYLKLIERMRQDHIDLAPAKGIGEGEDVVRVMSIHKSKGLEFPIVVIADMGKKFNEMDLSHDVLLHKTLGIGLKQYDAEWRLTYPTFIWNGLRDRLRWEGRAEEERVLYVAMTRARDKLILVGSVRDRAAQWNRWFTHPDPAQGMSYLDWIMPLFATNADWEETLEKGLTGFDSDECHGYWRVVGTHGGTAKDRVNEEEQEDTPLALVRQGKPTGADIPDWMNQTLAFRYAYPLATKVAAKYSVTELKRQYEARQMDMEDDAAAQPLFEVSGKGYSVSGDDSEEEDDMFSALPEWLDTDDRTVKGTWRGTVIHAFMEYVDVHGNLSLQGLTEQLHSLVEKGLMKDDEAKLVNLKGIHRFFQSDLGKAMAASPLLLREYPFTILLPQGKALPAVEEGEEFLIQGVIDCVFQDGDDWILVDYKTDYLANEKAFVDRYALQLQLYQRAVASITGKTVRHAYIYSFHLHQTIGII